MKPIKYPITDPEALDEDQLAFLEKRYKKLTDITATVDGKVVETAMPMCVYYANTHYSLVTDTYEKALKEIGAFVGLTRLEAFSASWRDYTEMIKDGGSYAQALAKAPLPDFDAHYQPLKDEDGLFVAGPITKIEPMPEPASTVFYLDRPPPIPNQAGIFFNERQIAREATAIELEEIANRGEPVVCESIEAVVIVPIVQKGWTVHKELVPVSRLERPIKVTYSTEESADVKAMREMSDIPAEDIEQITRDAMDEENAEDVLLGHKGDQFLDAGFLEPAGLKKTFSAEEIDALNGDDGEYRKAVRAAQEQVTDVMNGDSEYHKAVAVAVEQSTTDIGGIDTVRFKSLMESINLANEVFNDDGE